MTLVCAVKAQSAQQTATLRAGTPVTLIFLDDLSSANAADRANVTLVLSGNLTSGGSILVKGGTKVFAKISTVARAKATDRLGALTLELQPLHVGGQTIPLRARPNGGGSEVHYERPYDLKFPTSVFRTGDDVKIPRGTYLTVYAAQDAQFPASD